MNYTDAIGGAIAVAFGWAILGWLLFGLLSGGIPAMWLAGQKGRSEFAWLITGIFWGPLAVLPVGLAPRGASGQFGRCSECQEVIHLGARRCPHCRTPFVQPTEVNPYLKG